MSLSRRVAANFLASGWAALVSLALIPQYISYLGIEAFGLIGFFATLQAWLLVLDLGLGPAVNREMARHLAGAASGQAVRDLLRSAELVYVATACAVGAGILWLAPLIAGYWLQPRTLSADTVSNAVALMGLAVALQWMANLYRSALSGLQRQVWLSWASALSATLRGGGALVVLALVSATPFAFFVFQAAAGLVESLVLGWYLRRALPKAQHSSKFGLRHLHAVSAFAGGVSMAILLGTLLTQIDKLLLARLLPLDQFGYFSFAVTIAGALSVLIVPINNIAYPRLSEMVATRSKADIAAQYHAFAQLIAVGILPPAAVLCLFSENVVRVWTGDAVTAQAVAPLLSVWVIGTALNGLMHVPYAAQLAHGWPRLSAILNAFAALFMIPSVLLLVPHFGAVAAAWIWVAVNVCYLVLGIALMHARILVGEKWSWYGRDTAGPLLATLAAAALMWQAYRVMSPMSRLQEAAFISLGTAAMMLAAAIAAPLGRDVLRGASGYFQAWTTARK